MAGTAASPAEKTRAPTLAVDPDAAVALTLTTITWIVAGSVAALAVVCCVLAHNADRRAQALEKELIKKMFAASPQGRRARHEEEARESPIVNVSLDDIVFSDNDNDRDGVAVAAGAHDGGEKVGGSTAPAPKDAGF